MRSLRIPPMTRIERLPDGAIVNLIRGNKVEKRLRLGPNMVHAYITHADGSITDLGISHNLLTNSGRDLWAAAFGQDPAGQDGVATSTSATSLTKTAAGFTVDAYKGWRVWCPVTSVGTAPVYGNIGTNSATVLTIDQWWTEADGVGTTPAGTNAFQILPVCVPRFMALTENASAASASDTALTGELTTGSMGRALTTYAHTPGAATYTSTKAFSCTGTFPAVHKMGLLSAATLTATGILIFESVLNADANLLSGDTLTVTDTVTLSG